MGVRARASGRETQISNKNDNEQQPITDTKELDSKNENSNIIWNLWLLLFPILISQVW